MIPLAADDDALQGLVGSLVEAAPGSNVVYILTKFLAAGGMGSAFLATRSSPQGESQAVLKVLRPSFLAGSGDAAWKTVNKEMGALARLNDRVPPTPYVVRYLEAGMVQVARGTAASALPWLALEYVHGGVEGTTLTERVDRSLETTGYAFDPARAAQAVMCMAEGLSAIHELGVVHRDLKPDNILCCGFGDNEIFKITDFGVARSPDVAATFGNCFIGTPGYAAPEQGSLDARRMGPWSDVFALSAMTFFLLTGEDYFPADNPFRAIMMVREASRRKLATVAGLHPTLRQREQDCAALDLALARATAPKAEERPPSAQLFASSVLSVLKQIRKPRGNQARLQSLLRAAPDDTAGYRWRRIGQPTELVLRSAAWDSDGRCLAATADGLAFWNGTGWHRAPLNGFPGSVRFVRRISPGKWLMGGDGGALATYTSAGVSDVVPGDATLGDLVLASGDLDDLAVLVGQYQGGLLLHGVSSRRWLRPLPLGSVATLNTLARVDDAHWLLGGRRRDGQGYAAIYAPLQWEVTEIETPGVRAFLGSAGQEDRGLGLLVGTSGATVRYDGGLSMVEPVGAEVDLVAAHLDIRGRSWAAARGSIWSRGSDPSDVWRCVWYDNAWPAPIVSLFADVGLVLAASVDGAVLEGYTAAS